MRILVTGVGGQVGGALVPRLQKYGTVIPIDVDTLDFAKPDGLADAMDRMAPEVIINPAAYTAVDKAEHEPDLAMAVNATAPGIMARWAAPRAVPLKGLVHIAASGETSWNGFACAIAEGRRAHATMSSAEATFAISILCD
jgi:dTDP-4-dehydrorhamnose reductase